MGLELERDQLNARLAAQHAVARELLSADSLEEAAPTVLEAVATVLEWDASAAWEVWSPRDPLRLVSTWQVEDLDVERFWSLSRAIPFEPGIGLPGRAWEEGTIVWSTELEEEPDFPRMPAAAEVGLNAGFAIPVPMGDPSRVLAVLEFYKREFVEPDDQLKTLVVGFGDQLAQFIERRRAERAVRESEGLKSAILASAHDAVITIDHEGCVTEFNAAAETMFGHRREDAVGEDLASLVIPYELRERHRSALRRCVETGEGPIDRRLELFALKADGTEFPVELTITRMPGTDPPSFTGFVRDVAGRQDAEQVQRHLASIVESTEDAVETTDLDGVLTSWNPGAERLYGYTAEEAVGSHVSTLAPSHRKHEGNELIGIVRRGGTVENFETERVRADGAWIYVSLTVSPIADAQDDITGMSIIARDITARKRADEAKDFLNAASAALDASLDPATTIRTIAETAVPDLAELCVIDLRRDDGSIGDARAAAADPEVARRLEQLRRDYPLDPEGEHPVAQVLRSGRAVVLRDLTDPAVVEKVAQSDEHARFMRETGYTSAAVVPMVARGRTLGAITLLHVGTDRRYDSADLALLSDLGARSAMALDNARLYAERAFVARTLQRSLLPAGIPEVPGAEIAASFRPAGEGNEVGGDFYDVWNTGSGWAVIVGDVCGKGAEAAALTALIRYSVRALAAEYRSPAKLLALVNDAMVREDLEGRFATVVLALFDVEGGRASARLVSAGHPPPLIVRTAGSVDVVPERGTLLGVADHPELPETDVTLGTGDTLVLYTDGVLEAGAPGSVLTPDDLRSKLAGFAGSPARDVVGHVEEVALEVGGDRLRDDLAVLAVRVAS